jgi:hypothetical protein
VQPELTREFVLIKNTGNKGCSRTLIILLMQDIKNRFFPVVDMKVNKKPFIQYVIFMAAFSLFHVVQSNYRFVVTEAHIDATTHVTLVNTVTL